MNTSIQHQNYQINYAIQGTGETLIFLHGWPTNSKLWEYQIQSFEKKYRTIAIDWLGFGKSDKPTNHTYTFTSKKEILDTVLNDLLNTNEKVTIIAHDIGGPPAILWAYENQEKVNRLILLNTILFPFSTSTDKLSHILFKTPIINKLIVSNFGLKRLIKTMIQHKGNAVKERISKILDAHENLNSTILLKTILEPLTQGKKNELLLLENKFKQLKLPKFLVIAKKDPLCFAHMKKLHHNTPETPAYFIDNCGHSIPLDIPNELNAILEQILLKNTN